MSITFANELYSGSKFRRNRMLPQEVFGDTQKNSKANLRPRLYLIKYMINCRIQENREPRPAKLIMGQMTRERGFRANFSPTHCLF